MGASRIIDEGMIVGNKICLGVMLTSNLSCDKSQFSLFDEGAL